MINPLEEALVSLQDAANLCPVRRGGRPTHISTVYRWTSTGCKGVRLESLQVGGTRCTSKEALARFFETLTRQAATGSENEPVLLIPEDEVCNRKQSCKKLLGSAGLWTKGRGCTL